jgi:transketolase
MADPLRIRILEMIVDSGEGHIPSSFSIVDIIDHLYSDVMKYNVDDISNLSGDVFILSKGHGAAALYVVLEKIGAVSTDLLRQYGKPKGLLGGHPERFKNKQVMASTGSLGHGLPIASGIALGGKLRSNSSRVYCLLGDGECQEGTVWEAANIAANQKLNNLIAIVDWNGSAKQLMPYEDLEARWKAFGWNVVRGYGHRYSDLNRAFSQALNNSTSKPTVLILETIKGKGSKLIEGHGAWHHKIPNSEELESIMKDLTRE